jgi:hypothetical protein
VLYELEGLGLRRAARRINVVQQQRGDDEGQQAGHEGTQCPTAVRQFDARGLAGEAGD